MVLTVIDCHPIICFECILHFKDKKEGIRSIKSKNIPSFYFENSIFIVKNTPSKKEIGDSRVTVG